MLRDLVIPIRELVDSLIGMAWVKSHMTRVQNDGENGSLGLQNTLAIVYGPIRTYTCFQRPHTHLQSSTEELAAHTRFHDIRVLL